METILQAVKRKAGNRSELRKIRNNDQIPGVLYGKNKENIPLAVDRKSFIKILEEHGKNGIWLLDIEGREEKVVIIDYQRHPFSKEIEHVDFLVVDENTTIETDVQVVLVGEAYGVQDGGVLQQPLHSLSVTGRPGEIPDRIEIDVTDLKVRETIYVGDIKEKYPFTFNHRDDDVIASILPPKQEKEISTGEEQEPGIPENLEGRETNVADD